MQDEQMPYNKVNFQALIDPKEDLPTQLCPVKRGCPKLSAYLIFI